jgi:hypothetical protein
MSIDQANVVDLIATSPDDRKVILLISDHLEWTGDHKSDMEHMYQLQQKVNTYLEFLESGDIYRKYPTAAGKSISIRISAKYPMNKEGAEFFEKVRSIVVKYGYDMEFDNPTG